MIIAATEDSWEYTIVPRLMAAGADLTQVFRVEVEESNGINATLSLPRDLPAVERLIVEQHAAVMMLPPILSRLDAELDSHKDSEVRQALEPLVAVAERTNCSVLGLIHVNKSTSSDPLTMLMASRAFAAVARTVLFVMIDPEDDNTRLLGQPKNNLGRSDLPTLAFKINGVKVADTSDGAIWTGKLHWAGETDRSIREALQQASETSGGHRTAVGEAADWLQDYLTSKGGSADSVEVKKDGRKAGHSKDAIHRARLKLKIYVRPFPEINSGRWLASTAGGTRPLWSRNGEELFYVSLTGAVMRVGVERASSWAATTPKVLVKEGYVTNEGSSPGRTYDVSSDGQRFLLIKEGNASEENTAPPQLIVVQHFDEELKRLVPTK